MTPSFTHPSRARRLSNRSRSSHALCAPNTKPPAAVLGPAGGLLVSVGGLVHPVLPGLLTRSLIAPPTPLANPSQAARSPRPCLDPRWSKCVRRGGRHLTIDVVALQVRVAAAAEGLPAASKDLRAFADVLAPHVARFCARPPRPPRAPSPRRRAVLTEIFGQPAPHRDRRRGCRAAPRVPATRKSRECHHQHNRC